MKTGKPERRGEKAPLDFLGVRAHPSRLWLALWFVLGAILVGSTSWLVIRGEPTYEGRRLSLWLEELTGNPPGSPRRAAAEEAIRHMGTETLPHLLVYLRKDPPDAGREMNAWLDRQSWIDFRFPSPPDRSYQAVEAFKVLGPTAQPALPRLAEMVLDRKQCNEVAVCLAALGAPAIAALTNALSSTNRYVQMGALIGLGEMGPEAKPAIPAIITKIQGRDRMLSGIAIRALGELGDEAKPSLPLLSQLLAGTNTTLDAAFALSQLGSEGTLVLLTSLTNESGAARFGAVAALNPEFHRASVARNRRQRDFGFAGASRLFDVLTAMARNDWHQATQNGAIVPCLAEEFGNTDGAVRAKVAAMLGDCGFKAASANAWLSNALTDVDATVRQRAAEALARMPGEFREGGVVRGPQDRKRLALVFTGHEFAEGGEIILDELARHHAKGSFFLTGHFLGNPDFEPLVLRIMREGHYLGPHSDQHLLYCPWEGPKKTLVTQEAFREDLAANLLKIQHFGIDRTTIPFWLPAYEWYNQQIADWSIQMGLTVVNGTPGTRSNADYTEDAAPNFVPSDAIVESILTKERTDAHGLNGFLLLLHLGSGPARTDKMHRHFGRLLDDLAAKGYEFVRVDELLHKE